MMPLEFRPEPGFQPKWRVSVALSATLAGFFGMGG
jgi:hypothetical protein